MHTRRKFINQFTRTSFLAFLPIPLQSILAQSQFSNDTIIDEIEILKVSGPYTQVRGYNRQYQAQPIHLYDDHRPAPYKNPTKLNETTGTISQNYIRIKTRGGIEGIYGYLDPETITPILSQLRKLLLGKNAMAIEKLWELMYRNNRHSRAGHYMMALSALDNVLWDVRAKYFGVPLYQLLGGPTRKEARVYGSGLGFPIEKGKAGPVAKKLYEDGFHHQKWFLAFGPGSGNKGLKQNIELVEELRDAVGFEGELMFDAFMAWDLPYATAWAKAVEQYRPYWLEEAFPTNRLKNFVQLSKRTSIPIATGEHFYNRWEVINYLDANAIQIVQADPEWCGGVSELIKICNLASSYGVKVVPHGHNIHAALHVVLSQSPDVCPLVEYLINHIGYKLHFQKDPLLTKNGIIPLPTKSGFGIELDLDKIESIQAITE